MALAEDAGRASGWVRARWGALGLRSKLAADNGVADGAVVAPTAVRFTSAMADGRAPEIWTVDGEARRDVSDMQALP
jgi:hypothetical protein